MLCEARCRCCSLPAWSSAAWKVSGPTPTRSLPAAALTSLTQDLPPTPATPSHGGSLPLQGQGLNERQLALCDSFLYIPQYGNGTASLNVAVAASIVLHHFALWAGYPERPREVRQVAWQLLQAAVARGARLVAWVCWVCLSAGQAAGCAVWQGARASPRPRPFLVALSPSPPSRP